MYRVIGSPYFEKVTKKLMSNKSEIVVFRGKTSFAKILGDPVLNYSKDGKEWKMDLVLDKDTVKEAKKLGIGDRIKTKDAYLDGQPFMTFKQGEFRKDGKANDPIPVKDIRGANWDPSKLLGNGTDVDVKFAVVDHGTGKKQGVYIRSVRVLNLVPYERQEFEPVDEDDPFYANLAAAEDIVANAKGTDTDDVPFDTDDDDLDDDLPV